MNQHTCSRESAAYRSADTWKASYKQIPKTHQGDVLLMCVVQGGGGGAWVLKRLPGSSLISVGPLFGHCWVCFVFGLITLGCFVGGPGCPCQIEGLQMY